MAVAPTPSEIYYRAVDEGERRLDQPMLELVATSFIAGFTVVFGIAALGIVHATFLPQFDAIAPFGGALGFGVGLVFLIVGRAELFNENFFDPTARAIEADDTWFFARLGRLWVVTFLFNIVGGVLFAVVVSVDGTLPAGAPDVLRTLAVEIVHRPLVTGFTKGVVGGALVSLLSFLLAAADSAGSRIALAYVVGVLLALGPFDHVVVTVLHLAFGMLYGLEITLGTVTATTAVVTAGNLVGGLGLVTFTHVAQARGGRHWAA